MKTMKVTEETHKKLGEYGKKNETYDKIIRRLLENARNAK